MDTTKLEEFAAQIAQERVGAALSLLTHLGDQLGIWRAMAGAGPLTSADLAERTGLAERYLREWLAGQAVAGHVEYAGGRYTLPPEHAAVLADDDSPVAQAGAVQANAAMWLAADAIAEAFRTGEGFGWHRHDVRLFEGTARFFGPLYRQSLTQQWLPALDGVTARLESGARVLDVGCGHGSSTVLMAQAYPNSRFEGLDSHAGSITQAAQAAVKAGVEDRVRFTVGEAGQGRTGPWDLVCFFDALHDMGDPVGAAARARGQLAADGTLLVVEPYAADRFEDRIGDPVSMVYYAASTLCCVPNSLAQDTGTALGAQAGESRILRVLRDAGFTRARLALATDYNLVFEARG
ncbi:class I SAM-dependent methyltransferase [Nonomuraea muscovyensis]|uniref:SAM-dependent methyltransferase n=1 Tax=Nonomuraea muscovyensis TaxID=1124761 RepID=A0A7X0C2P8_9ACTN|nr:class I SAM-dependent methyltransferase [Nonomuraea muscovyensis]MBB6345569.1 SAM-dependent methyltransferase [Nonomuraea muscovyensis]